MDLPSFLRPLALAALPATLLALALEIVAGVTARGAVEASPLAIAGTAAVLVALLGIGATALAALCGLRDAGRGAAEPALAVVGTVLVAGGEWASLFVLPSVSTAAPRLLTSGALSSVTVGFVSSYAVFAVGWITTAVVLLRAGLVPTWLGVLLAVGGLAGMAPAPEPARLLMVAIAVLLVARRLPAAADATRPVRV